MKTLRLMFRFVVPLLPLLWMVLCIAVFTVPCFAQAATDESTASNNMWVTISNILQPLIVFGAVWVFKNWIAPNVPGIIIVSIIIPIASAIIAGITSLIGIPGTSFILQLVLGLLSNFVSQIVIQAKDAAKTA